MKTTTLAGIFALFGLGITVSFKPTLFESLFKTGDIHVHINSPQITASPKIEEKADKKNPLEAEYRHDCREAKSKESCKILAEGLAKEKVIAQLCSQIKSQTNIKIGDKSSLNKEFEIKSKGTLQGITVLKEGFEGNEYVYRIQAQNAHHLCNT